MQIDAIYVNALDQPKEYILFYVGETLTDAIARIEKENPSWGTMTIVLKSAEYQENPPRLNEAIKEIEDELVKQGGDKMGIARRNVLKAARALARSWADLDA